MAQRELSWTPLNKYRVEQVASILDELRPWWPVGVRSIHYQLLSRLIQWRPSKNGTGYYRNNKSESNMLSTLLKWARIDGFIPWSAISDEWRDIHQPRKHEDSKEYIEEELSWFLSDYRRCLLQNQPRYLECWVEKAALFRTVKNVAREYCLTTRVTRYDSTTHLKKFRDRAVLASRKGQKPGILYLGDLDPSGCNMEDSSINVLKNQLDCPPFTWERIALTPQQVQEYGLPVDPTAGKPSDTRYKKYVQKYGHLFVELDALHPSDLEEIVHGAIATRFDMEDFYQQKEIEAEELEEIESLKMEVSELVNKKFGMPNNEQ